MSVDNGPAKNAASTPTSRAPSTFDLLRWSDSPLHNATPPPVRISATNDSSAFINASNPSAADSPASRSAIRTNQPAGGISTISFGANLTLEETEALQRRRPGSESKRREMSGSGIFARDAISDSPLAFTPDKPMVRVQQPAGGFSHISFGKNGGVSPKKPTSLPEAAKQRELVGTLETVSDTPVRRPCSNAKARELIGSNIFGPPSDLPPKRLDRQLEQEQQENRGIIGNHINRNGRTSIKVSNPAGGRSQIPFGIDEPGLSSKKVHNQKVAELSGSNIFKDEIASATPEKLVSVAKLKEISGSDIFADEKPVTRDCVGGIRKPPGGGSSIALL